MKKYTINLTKAQAELLLEVVEQDIIRVEGKDMDNKAMILQRLYAISSKLDLAMEVKETE
jgi:transcription initiation factor TFIIIB Brf1 subunit/transcription initiation factor TFIIB